MRKRMPIKAAKDVARVYGQDQVILMTYDKATNLVHVVSYGKTVEDCDLAAQSGNRLKRLLGWPEAMSGVVPSRVAKLEAERDALAARVRVLEEALRSCRNLTHRQHDTPQDVRQIGLMVAATVDKALAATGKMGES